jgi:hypothetical protein
MKTIIGVVIEDSAGKVFKGEKPKRHADLTLEMYNYYSDIPYEEMPKIVFQGFYTNTNEIISREEAYILARQNGQTQVKKENGRLFSEDLW